MSYPKGFSNLTAQLKEKLSFEIKSVTEIKAGHNNKLFQVKSENKKVLLVKFYHQDNIDRLQREFGAISFLREKGFTNIPTTYFNNSKYSYAVYSYEKGISKNSNELTKKDLDEILSFIIKLQKFTKENVEVNFPFGIKSCVSVKGNIDNINHRLKEFLGYVRSKELHPEAVKQLKGIDPQKIIQKLLEKTLKNIETDLINYRLKQGELRLSPIDLGPHNIIFRPNNTLCFIDFEYFGWNDPVRIVVGFVNHDSNSSLPIGKKKYFVESYLQRTCLSENTLRRFDIVTRLNQIEWLTVYLSSIGSRKIESRKFADTNFEEETYIKEQIIKFRKKLRSIQKNQNS